MAKTKVPIKASASKLPAGTASQKQLVAAKLQKRHVADDHIQNVQAMMDPGEYVAGTTSVPSRAPWLRTVTTESTVLKLSAADGSIDPATGAFTVQASARPDNTLVVRSGAADNEDDLGMTGKFSVFEAAAGTNVLSLWELDHNGRASKAEPCTIVAGLVAVYAVPVFSTAGGVCAFVVTNPTQSGSFRVRSYTGPANALVAAGFSNAAPCATGGQSVTMSVTLSANTTHVTLEYSSVASRIMLTGVVSIFPGQPALTGLGSAGTVYSLQTLRDVEALRAYRIVGQSLLLTYTGSQINNGGEIAIARVYSNWQPLPGQTLYQAIMKLPKSRRYGGRAATGAHSFWVPATVEDLEPKLYGIDYSAVERPSLKIVAAGALDDPTESIMLQLETIVEFSTDAPSYASVDFAPPWNNFDVALQLAATINPNGENSKHLARIAKYTGAKARAALRYALDNPVAAASTIASIISALA